MPTEGQTGTAPDGTRVVWRNGRAVPLDAPGRVAKLSAPLQRDEIGDIENIQGAVGMNGMLDRTGEQIDRGELKLGPLQNVISQTRNAVGLSDQSSRNFASFRSNLEKLRNDSLRLNKGVQTEGDAQRAWNELFTNLNDENLVQQRLNEIEAINQRAIANRQQVITARRQAQGVAPSDTSTYARGTREQPIDLTNGGSRAGLAPGVYYRGPDKKLRRNENGDAGNPIVDERPAKKTGGKVKTSAVRAMSDDDLKRQLGL